MKTTELKVAQIGNSRGVRLPALSLRRYHIGDAVIMEERSDGILLRPVAPTQPKLTWEETAREMAAAAEDWSEWDAVAADGLALAFAGEMQWARRRGCRGPDSHRQQDPAR